jgi:hypothetical protein
VHIVREAGLDDRHGFVVCICHEETLFNRGRSNQ